MLRLLIKILRPTEAELRKRKPSFSLRTKIWLHRCLIKMLMHFYWRYVVHDILDMRDGTRVEIEIRDLEFEEEVACAKLDMKPQFQSVVVKPKKTMSRSVGIQWFYHSFDWQKRVTVSNSTGYLVIDHTAQTSLSGNLRATVMQAKSGALIDTVKLALGSSARHASHLASPGQDPRIPSKPRRSGRRRRVPPPSVIPETVIHNNPSKPQEERPNETPRRRIPPPEIKPQGEIHPPTDNEPIPQPAPPRPLKRMRGFDMDDSF